MEANGIITAVLARVIVSDIESALPLYERLTGSEEVRRFEFRGVQAAWVGQFLLLSGTVEAMDTYRRAATLMVSDIDRAEVLVRGGGGEILEGPADGPNGARMIARHPDGAVFEYIEDR